MQEGNLNGIFQRCVYWQVRFLNSVVCVHFCVPFLVPIVCQEQIVQYYG